MVDIIIGISPSAKVAAHPANISVSRERVVNARILDVRPSRKGRRRPFAGPDERRRPAPLNLDPSGSTVLVLMIKDSDRIPQDLKTGDYNISLRITPRKPEKAFESGDITA